MEVPVGEEVELERGHRAFERHLHDAHDELAAFPALEGFAQRDGAVDGVEVVHGLAPFVADQAGGHVGAGLGAGGDDELVVVEDVSAGQVNLVGFGVHSLDLRDDEVDAGGDEPLRRLDDVLLRVHPERDEEETGLVVVGFVLIDDRDLPIVTEDGTKLVDHHRSGGAGAEDDEFLH